MRFEAAAAVHYKRNHLLSFVELQSSLVAGGLSTTKSLMSDIYLIN